MDVVLGVAGGIIVIGGALGLLIRGVAAAVRGARRAARALDEVLGDGTDARPGWGRRLERIEQRMDGVDRRLVRVEDAVTRMPVALRGDNGRAVRQTNHSTTEV